MEKVPERVAALLRGKRLAVAGVSRQPGQATHAVYRKLRETSSEVFALNPNATEAEAAPCNPDTVGHEEALIAAPNAVELDPEGAIKGLLREPVVATAD